MFEIDFHMQRLTKAEEGLMLVLWNQDKAFLKDVVNGFPEPRPSQSTVSTLLRTLERKGFVTHKAYSKTFEYYPLIGKKAYLKSYFNDFLSKYFRGSYEELIQFISEELEMEMRIPEKEEKKIVEEPEEDLAQLSLW